MLDEAQKDNHQHNPEAQYKHERLFNLMQNVSEVTEGHAHQLQNLESTIEELQEEILFLKQNQEQSVISQISQPLVESAQIPTVADHHKETLVEVNKLMQKIQKKFF